MLKAFQLFCGHLIPDHCADIIFVTTFNRFFVNIVDRDTFVFFRLFKAMQKRSQHVESNADSEEIICYEMPRTLKSFIQRRGRARKEISSYVLVLDEDTDLLASSGWQELEDIMKSIYEDDSRGVQDHEDNDDDQNDEIYHVKSTG